MAGCAGGDRAAEGRDLRGAGTARRPLPRGGGGPPGIRQAVLHAVGRGSVLEEAGPALVRPPEVPAGRPAGNPQGAPEPGEPVRGAGRSLSCTWRSLTGQETGAPL